MGVFLKWGAAATQFRIERLESWVETLETENSELREALLDLVSLMVREMEEGPIDADVLREVQELRDRVKDIGNEKE